MRKEDIARPVIASIIAISSSNGRGNAGANREQSGLDQAGQNTQEAAADYVPFTETANVVFQHRERLNPELELRQESQGLLLPSWSWTVEGGQITEANLVKPSERQLRELARVPQYQSMVAYERAIAERALSQFQLTVPEYKTNVVLFRNGTTIEMTAFVTLEAANRRTGILLEHDRNLQRPYYPIRGTEFTVVRLGEGHFEPAIRETGEVSVYRLQVVGDQVVRGELYEPDVTLTLLASYGFPQLITPKDLDVNIRERARTESQVVGTLLEGLSARVYGQTETRRGNWLTVLAEGEVAWIQADGKDIVTPQGWLSTDR